MGAGGDGGGFVGCDNGLRLSLDVQVFCFLTHDLEGYGRFRGYITQK